MDQLIAQYLRERIEETGIGYRALASDTGMSINRIGIILRKEPPPATIGEVGRLASALGLTASGLLMRAEQDLLRNDVARTQDDYDLVANDSINEFPEGLDTDYDHA